MRPILKPTSPYQPIPAIPSMNCPFCHHALHPFQETDLHLDRCPVGHGIGLDGDELTAYRNAHPEVEGPKKEQTDGLLPKPGMPLKTCPRCEVEQLHREAACMN